MVNKLIKEGQSLTAPGLEYSTWLQKVKKFFEENDVDISTKQAIESAIQLSEHQHWFNKYRNDFLGVLSMFLNNESTEDEQSLIEVHDLKGDIQIMNKPNKNIFFVYGHGEDVMLRVKEHCTKEGYNCKTLDIHKYSDGILNAFISESKDCDRAVVIMTADDIVDEKYAQARPNVFIEFGYMLHKCGKDKTIVVSDTEHQFPTDIANMIHVIYGTENWKYDLTTELNKGDESDG